jgi:hypothetical protein
MVEQIINDISIWKFECKDEKWCIITDNTNNSLHCSGLNDEYREYFGKKLIDIKIIECNTIIEITTKGTQYTNNLFDKLKNEYNTKEFKLNKIC